MELLAKYGSFLSDSRSAKSRQDRLYIFDSTTITLFEEVLKGVGIRSLNGKRKGGIKVHTLLKSTQDVPVMIQFSASSKSDSSFLKQVQLPAGSILVFDRGYNSYHTFNQLASKGVTWVTRLRKDSVFIVTKQREVTQDQSEKGILADQEIILGHEHEKTAIKVPARLICYQDPETQRQFQFLTCNKRMAPATIAALYKKRWQIEVLFKRLKQNYPLKYFLGDSVNAIEIQIWCSLIADMLLKIIKKSTVRRWSFSNMASMIRIHLMTYIDLHRFLKFPEKALLNLAIKSKILNQTPTLFPT
jgi:transposase